MISSFFGEEIMIFSDFLSNSNTPFAIFSIFLVLMVVFLNGFTDAPNAIATIVSTKTLSMTRACILCAICNFLGLIIASSVNMSVAKSVLESASFGKRPMLAIACVLMSTIAFTIFAWMMAMPSSESHALIASIAGASLALSEELDFVPFLKIVLYMALSCLVSLILALVASALLGKRKLPYKGLQLIFCASLSLMHGAQDGQKLVAMLYFVLVSTKGAQNNMWIAVALVSSVILLGSLAGGGRIVKSMGDDISSLTPKGAVVSDASASATLIIFSALGAPVSTSNIKACSVAGAGLADKQYVNFKTLAKMAYVALLTFPCCMLMSYLLVSAFS